MRAANLDALVEGGGREEFILNVAPAALTIGKPGSRPNASRCTDYVASIAGEPACVENADRRLSTVFLRRRTAKGTGL